LNPIRTASVVAHEERVLRLLHDLPGDADRALDPLEAADGPDGVLGAPEEDGVVRDLALLVREAAEPDAQVLRVELGLVHALLDGVERVSAVGQHLPRLGVRGLAEFPRGDHGREARAAAEGERRPGTPHNELAAGQHEACIIRGTDELVPAISWRAGW
jgi:hypothetical protein